ncbi:MAG: glycosyltransferase family 1 protein [Sulfuriferula sp.]
MRIVIDLPRVQGTNSTHGIEPASLAFAQAMLRNCGKHEVIIAVNNILSDTVEPVRAALKRLLPQENIRVWNTSDLVTPFNTDNVWLSRAAKLIRENFLASLRPDIVLMTSFPDDFRDTPIHHQGLNNNSLQQSDLFFAVTEPGRQAVINQLNVPAERVVCISKTGANKDQLHSNPDLAQASTLLWDVRATIAITTFEQHYTLHDHPITAWLVDNITSITLPSAYKVNDATTHTKQLLVDISKLVQHDSKSGIQRVVRSILQELLTNPPDGFHVEPVYALPDRPGYRYARQFTLRFLGCPDNSLSDDLIAVSPGDIFFGLDLQPQVVLSQVAFYNHLKQVGAHVYFAIYDLLPVLRPQAFEDEITDLHAKWLEVLVQTDGAICISRAVAEEMENWLKAYTPKSLEQFKLGWFHLGADITSSKPTKGLPADAEQVMNSLAARPTFLSVGTVEPRKGQMQTLNAFEHLWSKGIDINLVIVGNHGWDVDLLVKRLRNHAERNHRLFWLEGISDEYLEKIYAASTCLIAASEGEGFGLPLIEAAQHKLPIIARDIPVFREVAGTHGYYFSGLEATELADAIQNWLALDKAGKAPQSNAMPWLTWKQSTQNLLDVILDDHWYRQWNHDDAHCLEIK